MPQIIYDNRCLIYNVKSYVITKQITNNEAIGKMLVNVYKKLGLL